MPFHSQAVYSLHALHKVECEKALFFPWLLRLYFHSAGNKEIGLDLKVEGSIEGVDLI